MECLLVIHPNADLIIAFLGEIQIRQCSVALNGAK
jgi:hypothetical protein